jgi:phage terminase large subunit-like protein
MNDNLQNLYKELILRQQYQKIDFLFQDKGNDNPEQPNGTWSRQLYPKSLEFFEAGSKYKERVLMGGNRTGKTLTGCVELVYHLTGLYPHWWKGHRFDGTNTWWAVSESSEMSVKTLQRTLLGEVGDPGSGLIPKKLIDFESLPTATKIGVGVSGIRVKHISGGYSTLEFKSIQQGVASFVGTTVSIFVDELLTLPIYNECLTRITLGNNIFIHTFTPILGYTDQISTFFGDEGYRTGKVNEYKYCVSTTIFEVPHIPKVEQDRLYQSWPEYQKQARAKGIPQLGQGQVFPYSEDMIKCEPFTIPKHWKKVSGLDVGWRAWASCWFAINPDDGKVYCYSSYKCGEKTPLMHWTSLKTRGDWIPFAADPASHGRSQNDGKVIFDQLEDFGMNISNADNSREAGIYDIAELFVGDQLKIFSTEVELIRELLNLARDDKGLIKNSSAMHMFDAFRYGVHTRELAKSETIKKVGGQFSNNRW